MVLRFSECVNGIFYNKLLDTKFTLFILDMDKNELYPFSDMLDNDKYLLSREIDEEELTFRFEGKEFYLSFDENRFVPMMCFADFTENPFHMVRTLKFNCNFMDKHFRLALNCIQKKLVDKYIYDVEATDPRVDLTSYYATSYVFDYNPRMFRNHCTDVTNEIKEFMNIVPKEKNQIEMWFNDRDTSSIYCVSALKDKKIISSITLVYHDKQMMFKMEVEEDVIPLKSVWKSYVENDEKVFVRACETVSDWLEKVYGIIGFEMTIEEFMNILHGDYYE